jgi:hypothetical protein
MWWSDLIWVGNTLLPRWFVYAVMAAPFVIGIVVWLARRLTKMFTDDKAAGESQAVPTVRGFLDFVSKQPALKEYSYFDNKACACAQYANEIGDQGEWLRRTEDLRSPWHQLDGAAVGRPRTFGALARRLEALKDECKELSAA